MGKMNTLIKILLLSGELAPTLIDPINLSIALKSSDLD